MGANSQAGVMTAEWTLKTLSALSALLFSPTAGETEQQKPNHPGRSLEKIGQRHSHEHI